MPAPERGLGRCADTIIGGVMQRGVSGGERKRVAIGVELLTDPSVSEAAAAAAAKAAAGCG